MSARKTPLAGVFDERAVLDAFAHERLTAHRWSNSPHDAYGAHSHTYHKVLYCLRGSIVFRLTATGEEFELHAGDRLDIEPGIGHSGEVGSRGVVCIEAARAAPEVEDRDVQEHQDATG